MRQCKTCEELKPLEEFYRSAGAKGGRQHECKKCTETRRRNFDKKCRDEGRISRGALTRHALRMRVLLHYSDGSLKCACPGCNTPPNMEFLAIDHVNQDGAAHRKAVGRGSVYRDIERRGYPPGYRVLCHNCNASYYYYGYCPHVSPELTRAARAPLTIKQRTEERLLEAAKRLDAAGVHPALKSVSKEAKCGMSTACRVRARLWKEGKWPYRIDLKYASKAKLSDK